MAQRLRERRFAHQLRDHDGDEVRAIGTLERVDVVDHGRDGVATVGLEDGELMRVAQSLPLRPHVAGGAVSGHVDGVDGVLVEVAHVGQRFMAGGIDVRDVEHDHVVHGLVERLYGAAPKLRLDRPIAPVKAS